MVDIVESGNHEPSSKILKVCIFILWNLQKDIKARTDFFYNIN